MRPRRRFVSQGASPPNPIQRRWCKPGRDDLSALDLRDQRLLFGVDLRNRIEMYLDPGERRKKGPAEFFRIKASRSRGEVLNFVSRNLSPLI